MSRSRIVLMGSTVVTLWGSAFVLVRLALTSFSPIDLCVLRFAIAGAMFLGLLATGAIRYRPVERRDWLRLVGGAALAIPVYHIALNIAQTRVPAVSAAFFGQLTPPITFVFSSALGMERFSSRRALGLGVALIGAVILMFSSALSPDLHGAWLHLGLALVPPVALAAFTIVNKPLVERYGALNISAQTVVLGSLMIAPVALTTDGIGTRAAAASPAAWVALVALAAGVTVTAYALWSTLLKGLERSQVASLINFTPAVTMMLSVLLLGEQLRAAGLIGGAIMVAGTALVLRSNAAPRSVSLNALPNISR